MVAPPHEFKRAPHLTHRAGSSFAAAWFMERGYTVSVPLESVPYDLVTESDGGLRRIQVKTTRSRETQTGRYRVHLHRCIYDASGVRNAHGQMRQVSYTSGEVDYFFILTASRHVYLIPLSVIAEKKYIVLDTKYSGFLQDGPP
ncbi:group I intron-associated PD-(D/E)XK endonuclease [Plantactinospora alkalitolerans]|uniref:group I intron-associated PD-(D/E)XK endonuclease n=1 Tax=Plantactinospora alkalitolerans TaxID=2789879 RepID=UPI003899B9B8